MNKWRCVAGWRGQCNQIYVCMYVWPFLLSPRFHVGRMPTQRYSFRADGMFVDELSATMQKSLRWTEV